MSRRKSKSRKQAKRRSANKNISRATSTMTLTQLQILAKTKGIAFGGLTKSQLISRINHYQ